MKHVLVVGAGVIGLCCAYELRKAGFEVTVAERDQPDHHPASWGNAGMIVPSHFVPLAAPGMVRMGLSMLRRPDSPFGFSKLWDLQTLGWAFRFANHCSARHVKECSPVLAAMHLASRQRYIELQEEIGDFELAARGLLSLCKTTQDLDEESHLIEGAQKVGVRARRLNREETAQADPGTQMDVAGSVLFEDDGHLNPMLFSQKLKGKLTEMGVPIVYGLDPTRVDALPDDVPEPWRIVLAAGAWSNQFVPWRMPMLGGKGYSFLVQDSKAKPELCSLLVGARVAVTPMGGQIRFGGTMEIGPPDLSLNQRRIDGIKKSIPQFFPQFSAADFDGLPVWSGLRPCSPDGMPYIGIVDRTVVATGHGMMGVSLAPITGKLVAQILTDQTTEIDLTLCRPQRFA